MQVKFSMKIQQKTQKWLLKNEEYIVEEYGTEDSEEDIEEVKEDE